MFRTRIEKMSDLRQAESHGIVGADRFTYYPAIVRRDAGRYVHRQHRNAGPVEKRDDTRNRRLHLFVDASAEYSVDNQGAVKVRPSDIRPEFQGDLQLSCSR